MKPQKSTPNQAQKFAAGAAVGAAAGAVVQADGSAIGRNQIDIEVADEGVGDVDVDNLIKALHAQR